MTARKIAKVAYGLDEKFQFPERNDCPKERVGQKIEEAAQSFNFPKEMTARKLNHLQGGGGNQTFQFPERNDCPKGWSWFGGHNPSNWFQFPERNDCPKESFMDRIYSVL